MYRVTALKNTVQYLAIWGLFVENCRATLGVNPSLFLAQNGLNNPKSYTVVLPINIQTFGGLGGLIGAIY